MLPAYAMIDTLPYVQALSPPLLLADAMRDTPPIFVTIFFHAFSPLMPLRAFTSRLMHIAADVVCFATLDAPCRRAFSRVTHAAASC